MVIRLGKGKVDENLLKLVLEMVSDLERRLLRVERQVEALVQEVYGFKYLETEGGAVEGGVNVMCGEEKRESGGEVRGESFKVDPDGERSTLKKGAAIIPRVKLAS
ncbi:MAG: hypothetical protein QW513_04065 [Candidatus Jordarchaeales archaeon]